MRYEFWFFLQKIFIKQKIIFNVLILLLFLVKMTYIETSKMYKTKV